MWEQQLKLYDSLVATCPKFERLGKTMPYTAVNGYMFSLLNKAGEIGIRFSKEAQEKYMASYSTTHYKSYGAIMKGYILITPTMLEDKNLMTQLLNESYDHFSNIEPNKHKRK